METLYFGTYDGSVLAYQRHNDLYRIRFAEHLSSSSISSMDAHESLCAVASEDGIRILDGCKRLELCTLRSPDAKFMRMVKFVKLQSGGPLVLMSLTEAGELTIWRTKEWSVIESVKLKMPSESRVVSAALNPTDITKLAVVLAPKGLLEVFHTGSGQRMISSSAKGKGVRGVLLKKETVSWSIDGRYLITLDDNGLECDIMDLQSAQTHTIETKCLPSKLLEAASLQSIRFTSVVGYKNLLAVGTNKGLILLFSIIDSGADLHAELWTCLTPGKGAGNRIKTLALTSSLPTSSPKTNSLVSVTTDGCLSLWTFSPQLLDSNINLVHTFHIMPTFDARLTCLAHNAPPPIFLNPLTRSRTFVSWRRRRRQLTIYRNLMAKRRNAKLTKL